MSATPQWQWLSRKLVEEPIKGLRYRFGQPVNFNYKGLSKHPLKKMMIANSPQVVNNELVYHVLSYNL